MGLDDPASFFRMENRQVPFLAKEAVEFSKHSVHVAEGGAGR